MNQGLSLGGGVVLQNSGVVNFFLMKDALIIIFFQTLLVTILVREELVVYEKVSSVYLVNYLQIFNFENMHHYTLNI